MLFSELRGGKHVDAPLLDMNVALLEILVCASWTSLSGVREYKGASIRFWKTLALSHRRGSSNSERKSAQSSGGP